MAPITSNFQWHVFYRWLIRFPFSFLRLRGVSGPHSPNFGVQCMGTQRNNWNLWWGWHPFDQDACQGSWKRTVAAFAKFPIPCMPSWGGGSTLFVPTGSQKPLFVAHCDANHRMANQSFHISLLQWRIMARQSQMRCKAMSRTVDDCSSHLSLSYLSSLIFGKPPAFCKISGFPGVRSRCHTKIYLHIYEYINIHILVEVFASFNP